MTIELERLTRFATECLQKTGLPTKKSREAAEALVLTDSWGVFTHGTKNLRGYIRRLLKGGLNPHAEPEIQRQAGAWAIVNAHSALAMNSSLFAIDLAVQKAQQFGIGYVGVRNSCHFGAAGVYALRAAEKGLIGIAMANDTPTVSIPGSVRAVLGSNPLAIAIPSSEPFPILLDIATSAVAGGKVFQAASENRAIPEGWIIDDQGKPATDPKLFPNHASLVPMAGHKGYGIGLWIETLSAVLTGASIGSQVLSWSFEEGHYQTNHGAAFIAIDVASIIGTDDFNSRISQLIHQIRSAPRSCEAEPIRVPGEIEYLRRAEALFHGVLLPADVIKPLKLLSQELDIMFPELPSA